MNGKPDKRTKQTGNKYKVTQIRRTPKKHKWNGRKTKEKKKLTFKKIILAVLNSGFKNVGDLSQIRKFDWLIKDMKNFWLKDFYHNISVKVYFLMAILYVGR